MEYHKKISIGEWLWKNRIACSAAYALFILTDAEASAFSATIGLIIMAAGLLVRTYSIAFLGSESPSERAISENSLVTTGPYQLIRYPAYLGTIITILGLAIFGGDDSTFIFVLIALLFQYFFITEFEDDRLTKLYSEEFALYKSQTPKWLPKLPLNPSFLEIPNHVDAIFRKNEKLWLAGCGVTLLLLAVFS